MAEELIEMTMKIDKAINIRIKEREKNFPLVEVNGEPVSFDGYGWTWKGHRVSDELDSALNRAWSLYQRHKMKRKELL